MAKINSFITAKTALKKLQLGLKKQFVLHTGKKHNNFRNSELYVDGQKLRDVKNAEKDFTLREDILEGEMEISHMDSET